MAEALLDLERTYRSSTWSQPADAPRHRAMLATCLDEGSDLYPIKFGYPELDLDGYLRDLDALAGRAAKEYTGSVASAVTAELDQRREYARAVASGRDDKYATALRKIEGLPTVGTEAAAEAILARDVPRRPTENFVEPEALQSRIRAALNRYNLVDWSVVVSTDMSARVSVNGPLRRVRVSADAQFSALDADRLLVHEVGGHVLRWANSWRQPLPAAVIPLGRSVATEEGLALWAETQHRLLDPGTLRLYAARVLAVSCACESGILQVARTIEPYIGRTRAVETAVRVKRGLRDPNGPGGMTKDYGYLEGLLSIRDLHTGDAGRVEVLRSVKWSIDLLPLAEELHASGSLRPAELTTDSTLLGLQAPLADHTGLGEGVALP